MICRKVEVTEKDIENGDTRDGTCCPVSLALRRQGFEEVYVGYSKILLNGIDVRMPSKVRMFVEDFDLSLKVKPFSFILFSFRL